MSKIIEQAVSIVFGLFVGGSLLVGFPLLFLAVLYSLKLTIIGHMAFVRAKKSAEHISNPTPEDWSKHRKAVEEAQKAEYFPKVCGNSKERIIQMLDRQGPRYLPKPTVGGYLMVYTNGTLVIELYDDEMQYLQAITPYFVTFVFLTLK